MTSSENDLICLKSGVEMRHSGLCQAIKFSLFTSAHFVYPLSRYSHSPAAITDGTEGEEEEAVGTCILKDLPEWIKRYSTNESLHPLHCSESWQVLGKRGFTCTQGDIHCTSVLCQQKPYIYCNRTKEKGKKRKSKVSRKFDQPSLLRRLSLPLYLQCV